MSETITPCAEVVREACALLPPRAAIALLRLWNAVENDAPWRGCWNRLLEQLDDLQDEAGEALFPTMNATMRALVRVSAHHEALRLAVGRALDASMLLTTVTEQLSLAHEPLALWLDMPLSSAQMRGMLINSPDPARQAAALAAHVDRHTTPRHIELAAALDHPLTNAAITRWLDRTADDPTCAHTWRLQQIAQAQHHRPLLLARLSSAPTPLEREVLCAGLFRVAPEEALICALRDLRDATPAERARRVQQLDGWFEGAPEAGETITAAPVAETLRALGLRRWAPLTRAVLSVTLRHHLPTLRDEAVWMSWPHERVAAWLIVGMLYGRQCFGVIQLPLFALAMFCFEMALGTPSRMTTPGAQVAVWGSALALLGVGFVLSPSMSRGLSDDLRVLFAAALAFWSAAASWPLVRIALLLQ